MDKIYVVVGTTGSYSDRQEWCARAFSNADDAQSFAFVLNSMWASELAIAKPTVDVSAEPEHRREWTRDFRACQVAYERMLKADPLCCGCDYPKWDVAEVPWGAP
jgi:hypothetical protein